MKRKAYILCAALLIALCALGLAPDTRAEALTLTVVPHATEVYCGDTLIWQAQLSGGEGEITYQYTLSRDGGIVDTETSTVGEYSYNTGLTGKYELTVVARDSQGNVSNTAKSASVTMSSTCDSIKLDKTTVTIVSGQMLNPVNVTIEPAGANPELVWYTNGQETAVSVDEKTGVVQGRAIGGQYVTVRAVGSTAQASYYVNVVAATGYVERMTLNLTQANGVVGGKLQLKARLVPEDVGNPNIVWTTSNASVATVSGSGLVTAVGPGTATITAHASAGVTASCNVTIKGAAVKYVKQVKLNHAAATGVPGGTLQLKAAISPANADNLTLIWETNDASVATVSQTGLVTAVGAGSCSIRAMAQDGGGAYAICKITVKNGNAKITGVKLNHTAAKGIPGGTLQLKAAVSPAGAQNKTLIWETNNANVATVSQTGLVTAVGAGTCSIRAMAQDGSGKYAICKITIVNSNRPVNKIALNHDTAKGVPGGKLQLKATITPKNATNTGLKWESSDVNVATVTDTGLVTAVANGSCWIRAMAVDGSGKYAMCKVIIAGGTNNAKVAKIALNHTSAQGVVGGKLQLRATISPANAADRTVIWETSDDKIATVDQTGLVKAVGKGSCWIRALAKDGSGVYALCAIRIK